MKSGSHPLLRLGLGLLLVWVAFAAYTVLSRKTMLPDVYLTTLEGKALTSADLRGKVVLVNFWATTCSVCVHEMPRIVETWNTFAPRGFDTVAVAMSYDPPSYVANYARLHGLPFHVALDVNGDAARSFGDIHLTPTSFLIDRQGRIVRQYQGEPDFEQLQQLVDELLKQPA